MKILSETGCTIMKERLHKFLAAMGIASRRASEKLIAEGHVTVNGAVVPPGGMLIDRLTDVVAVDGKAVVSTVPLVYYALHKPAGYASTVKDFFCKEKVIDLVPSFPAVYPAGRLDITTEGLIILTNDGDFAMKLTHPSFQHEKEYLVRGTWKNPLPSAEGRRLIESLAGGVQLDDGMTLPAVVTIKRLEGKEAVFSITLREGRKRQVRRMCMTIGITVRKLVRIRIGKLRLEGIAPGTYRMVKPEDII